MKTLIRRHSKESPWTYSRAEAFQKELSEKMIEANGEGVLLLSEFSPVITLGRRTEKTDLLVGEREYTKKGIEILQVTRGGLATYHGPGQWVFFPIERLERLSHDSKAVKLTVERLLKVTERVATQYDSTATADLCDAGVFTSRGKVASVGVQVRERILNHGVAINFFRTAESFYELKACGKDREIDFLFDGRIEERRYEAEFEKVSHTLVHEFFREFGSDRLPKS